MIDFDKFVIEACGQTVIARFCDEIAPYAAAELRKILPYKAPGTFAKIAGDETYFAVPFSINLDEERPAMEVCKRGSISYWPKRPHLCFFYEPPQYEEQPAVICAQIIENVDGMGIINQSVREKQGCEISLRFYDDGK